MNNKPQYRSRPNNISIDWLKYLGISSDDQEIYISLSKAMIQFLENIRYHRSDDNKHNIGNATLSDDKYYYLKLRGAYQARAESNSNVDKKNKEEILRILSKRDGDLNKARGNNRTNKIFEEAEKKINIIKQNNRTFVTTNKLDPIENWDTVLEILIKYAKAVN